MDTYSATADPSVLDETDGSVLAHCIRAVAEEKNSPEPVSPKWSSALYG